MINLWYFYKKTMDEFRKGEITLMSQGRPSLPSATFLDLCHIK